MNDDFLRGVEAARYNKQKQHPRSPWTRPDNYRCLCPNCDSPVYHDGQIYWSLCLKHLEEKQLGPFFPRIHEEDYRL